MPLTRNCTLLLLDSADRYGHADPQDAADDAALARVVQELTDAWPRHALHVNRCVPGTAWLAARSDEGATAAVRDGLLPAAARRQRAETSQSPYFTDIRRVRDAVPSSYAHVLLVRPAAVLLPLDVLRAAATLARTHGADVATIAGVPGDVFQVVSADAISLLDAAGPVPRSVTVADAIERLRGAGAIRHRAALKTMQIAAHRLKWDGEHLARALPMAVWKRMPRPGDLACASAERLERAVRHAQELLGDARASLERWRGKADGTASGEHRPVLVTVPSMYQSGANSAWEEASAYLSPRAVAFVVGRATALTRVLAARGFTVFETTEGLAARSVSDAAVFLRALATVCPDVVHFDGIEGNVWAPLAFARGARIVQHLRLNDPDRFRPVFGYADAVVTVSEHLRCDVAARVGETVRVVHVADGVRLDVRAPRQTPAGSALSARSTPVPDGGDAAAGPCAEGVRDTPGELSCLCVGRVEPEKGQLRVLDIVSALAEEVPCRLVMLGSCGSDPAYCDEVTRRVLAPPGGMRAEWHSFAYPIAHCYERADVVLVGSRNEALGMVGLEALAAGCLLVAHRSTGYANIVDETQREGLLFDVDDAPHAIAARIRAALAEGAHFAAAARRKAETAFDARTTADRLASLWLELRPAR